MIDQYADLTGCPKVGLTREKILCEGAHETTDGPEMVEVIRVGEAVGNNCRMLVSGMCSNGETRLDDGTLLSHQPCRHLSPIETK
jgi:hypothetical protein